MLINGIWILSILEYKDLLSRGTRSSERDERSKWRERISKFAFRPLKFLLWQKVNYEKSFYGNPNP